MNQYTKEVGATDFVSEVLDRSCSALVLVDFWAEWCGPCRSLTPLLEKVVESYQGRVLLAKVNSDREQQLADEFGVRSIPNVKAFRDGRWVDEFTGALPEGALRAFIERWLPSPAQGLVDQAIEQRRAGAAEAAEALLRQALEADPDLESAVLELADLLIERGATDEAGGLLGPLAYKARDEDRLRELNARLSLAASSHDDPDSSSLRQRVEADPDDLEARLALGRQLAGQQRWSEALEMLLEVVRRDRSYGDDAGRKTMLDVFNLMPPDHPELRGYRARLAQAIHR